MITIEDINFSEVRNNLQANADSANPNPEMRLPETALGFLTSDQAHEYLKNEGRITCWSNDTITDRDVERGSVVFFSGGFENYRFLKNYGFHSFLISQANIPPRPSLPTGRIETPSDILAVYYPGCQWLQTEEELLSWFNERHEAQV